MKEVEKKIEVSTTWTPERIGDLHEQQLMLQESLENIRKLMVNHFLHFFGASNRYIVNVTSQTSCQ